LQKAVGFSRKRGEKGAPIFSVRLFCFAKNRAFRFNLLAVPKGFRPVAFIYARSFLGPLALLHGIPQHAPRAFVWACCNPWRGPGASGDFARKKLVHPEKSSGAINFPKKPEQNH
jgi:hypothetical protein